MAQAMYGQGQQAEGGEAGAEPEGGGTPGADAAEEEKKEDEGEVIDAEFEEKN